MDDRHVATCLASGGNATKLSYPHCFASSFLTSPSFESSDIISNLCTDKDTCNFYLESYLSLTSNIVNFIGIKKDIKYFSNSIESIFSTRIHLYKQRITFLGMVAGVFGCRVVCTKCGEQKQSKPLRDRSRYGLLLASAGRGRAVESNGCGGRNRSHRLAPSIFHVGLPSQQHRCARTTTVTAGTTFHSLLNHAP